MTGPAFSVASIGMVITPEGKAVGAASAVEEGVGEALVAVAH